MSESFRFALKRSALIYACVVALAVGGGIVWAVTEHHKVGFCVGVFHYLAAAVIIAGATFTQSRPRKEYIQLTIEERRKSFSTHMWLVAIGVAVIATGIALQFLL
jgi:cytochrome c biogenesis factor